MDLLKKRALRPSVPEILADQIVWLPTQSLIPYPNNPRTHSDSQVRALANTIRQLGFASPIIIDENNVILAGHGRLEAAKQLGLPAVPTIMVSGLSQPQKRALLLADNKLGDRSGWNDEALKLQLETILAEGLEIEITGFETAEADLRLEAVSSADKNDPADSFESASNNVNAVTRPGDVWLLGKHRVLCADSLQPSNLARVLCGEKAQLVLADPPYNLKVRGQVRGNARKQYREFAMASGEMSSNQFAKFLIDSLTRMVGSSRDGAILYIFMDWRHLFELLEAARQVGIEQKNLLVWKKSNAGQGAFYRSQHELIAVFKVGAAPHINNFGMGDKGRYRTNVLEYAGANTFSANRVEIFNAHPTVKPCALVSDLLRDCSRRNGVVLDPFGGSGTTLIAAERTGRCARLVEIDPAYVDLTIQRWEKLTGLKSILEGADRTYDEIRSERNLDAKLGG